MDWWMYVILGFSGVILVAGMYLGNNPEVQQKLAKKYGVKSKKDSIKSSFDEDDLKDMQDTAEDFLEFDTIENGMISFKKDPNYFTMAFGIEGVNISMYSSRERLVLKNGFMSILNSLKDDTQFLVQSRYIDLSDNVNYYKPIIEKNKIEKENLMIRVKDETNEPLKRKMTDKIEKLDQRNNYANHIIDFFNFYTRESKCIYIRVFAVVGYRYTGSSKWKKQKVSSEAYAALSNKVKILKEQFEGMGLKTYQLDNLQTANILYSTISKDESSYSRLKDAIENGMLDLAVQALPGEPIDSKYDRYDDKYKYPYMDETASSFEDDDYEE